MFLIGVKTRTNPILQCQFQNVFVCFSVWLPGNGIAILGSNDVSFCPFQRKRNKILTLLVASSLTLLLHFNFRSSEMQGERCLDMPMTRQCSLICIERGQLQLLIYYTHLLAVELMPLCPNGSVQFPWMWSAQCSILHVQGKLAPFGCQVPSNRFKDANAGPSVISQAAADEGSRTGIKGSGILSSIDARSGVTDRSPSEMLLTGTKQKTGTHNSEPESSISPR